MIERIDNVGVAVTNFERAVEFYRRLGFEVQDHDASTPSAMLRAGEARFWIYQTASASGRAPRAPDLLSNPPGFDHVSLWVADVDAAAKAAQERGAVFESEPADQEWGYRATSALDPDGNRVFLLGPLRD
jgi:catechol 2,3-dioxygenase-like lactoylglutathione lyase family enzyme